MKRNRYPVILNGVEIFIDDELDAEEEADEVPALMIDDGVQRIGPRTIFMETIYANFEVDCLNILGLMKLKFKNDES